MSGPYRLPSGGAIARSRSISFGFDGQRLQGFQGDTLASALLANGVRVQGRSSKFHRPRGVFSCGIEEPNALVQIGEGATAVPSARATVVPLVEGLQARAQTGWPNVNNDWLRILDVFAPMFAAGFYNRTFMWPSWHWFEPIIRRVAGLGRAPSLPDPDRYQVHNAHCDVLIVGAGPAGLSAALAAARAGSNVWLVDEDEHIGGSARWCSGRIQGESAQDWIHSAEKVLAGHANVRMLTRTAAVGIHDHCIVTLNESCPSGSATRERLWIVRAERVILATGAFEQPLVFEHNDRPGIMLAGAARFYLQRHAIAPGRQVLIATNNDSVYELVPELLSAGVKVVGIADSRPEISDAIARELRQSGIPFHLGTLPFSSSGGKALRSATLRRIGDGQQTTIVTDCDALLVSGGWSPRLQLYAQAGGKLTFREDVRSLVCGVDAPGITVVGAAAVVDPAPATSGNIVGPRISAAGNPWRQWVDLRHDVTVGDLQLAMLENYRSIEHLKRYTTLGMSVDQGKTSTAAAIEIAAGLQGVNPSALGYTTMRPPATPVTLGAIAGIARGELFAPWRETPLHHWNRANRGLIEQYGEWQRAACYLKPGETRHQAILREARLVRSAAGIFDASPLGKIEIHGPDAREFLDRFYINRVDTLQAGRVRYGIMLRESGVVFDDGTIAVLDPERLLITTTSGNAHRVAAWLEEWHQCEWPSLRVVIVPVTEQWATMSLAGPQSRAILTKLKPTCDLGAEAFPHLSLRIANLLGVPARIYRVSFSGELTYEINVPSDAAQLVWEALLSEGRSEGLDAFGVEALLQLRLEKAYLHVGADTDGTTVPNDIGWGTVARAKAKDYIGKRSLSLPENVRPDRKQLVGLRSVSGEPLRAGAHVRVAGSSLSTDGWITSAGKLDSDGSSIALALIREGRSQENQIITVYDEGRERGTATVVTQPFYDPAGARLNA